MACIPVVAVKTPATVILFKVDTPTVAFVLPARVPWTLPVSCPWTLPIRVPETVKLFPTDKLPLNAPAPSTSNSVDGWVLPIPSEPPMPVSVINLAELIPLCQWKSPATAPPLFPLIW